MRSATTTLSIGSIVAAAVGCGFTGDQEAHPAADSLAEAAPDPVVVERSLETKVDEEAPLPGILAHVPTRPEAWPDTVGLLMPRRLDEPGIETIEGFFVYLPPGFPEQEEEWPVLFYLHGRSLRGDDLDLLKRYGIPSLIEDGFQPPFIVVAPQLPDGQRWVDTERMWTVLERAIDPYPIDDDRVYVTGYSMGAGGTWRFAAAHAGRLAAAIPISATTPVPSEMWADALEDLPMLVYHGDADELAPYEPALEMVSYLEERGVPIALVTIRAGSHSIVQEVYGDPELYLWLLAHER
jgi:pimeloyl-ACP methyl ester carboxylesterase